MSQYICVDKDNYLLEFETKYAQKYEWISTTGWKCPFNQKFLSTSNIKKVSTTDVLLNFIEHMELSDEKNRKSLVQRIKALKIQVKKYESNEYFYPKTARPKQKVTVSAEGTEATKFFKIADKVTYRDEATFKKQKESYASLVNIIRQIKMSWSELDKELKNYGVNDKTPMAYDKKCSIYYEQLKMLSSPITVYGNNHEPTIVELVGIMLKHEYKIEKNGEWTSKLDYIYPQFENIIKKNLDYVLDFSIPELVGRWFVEVPMEVPIEDTEYDYSFLTNIKTGIMKIDTDHMVMGKKLFDSHKIIAEVIDGKIKTIQTSFKDPELEKYCVDFNAKLEKTYISRMLSTVPAIEEKKIENTTTKFKI